MEELIGKSIIDAVRNCTLTFYFRRINDKNVSYEKNIYNLLCFKFKEGDQLLIDGEKVILSKLRETKTSYEVEYLKI